MRIGPENLGQALTGLLQARGALQGQVQRITAAAVVIRWAQGEIELPLSLLSAELKAALRPGLPVELQRSQGNVSVRIAQPKAPFPGHEQPAFTAQTLEESLLALDIVPTAEAQEAAKALLERGFPLQKELLRSILPWAEQGKLEEALLLSEAKFPVTTALVELVSELREQPVLRRELDQPVEELPPELKQALRQPALSGRTALSGRGAFRAAARLVAAEQFINSLLAARGGEEAGFVFFLPFLQGRDLSAAWVRIAEDDAASPDEDGQQRALRLELLLPTQSFGLVRVELLIWGRKAHLQLRAEQAHKELEGNLAELEEELSAAGWELSTVKVGELAPCAKQLLYAMIET